VNRESFARICQRSYGREVIYTNAKEINETNLAKELAKAISIHWQNRREIDYLDKYYSGDQPILYRQKNIRKEINNKIVENHAFEIVEHKTAEMFGEPVQYVLKGADEGKTGQIKTLNDLMDSEDKGNCDIDIGRWRSICGTAYRYIWVDSSEDKVMDEAPFGISCEDPRDTFVVYSSESGHKPMYSVQCRKTELNEQYYFINTEKMQYEVKNGIVKEIGINGMFMIPIIEYPNNARRISDLEIVITLLDEVNKMQSDRMNGIEQFVQALMKFVNCEIDKDGFLEMLDLGAVKVKSPQGVKSDVAIMSSELNQEQSQIAKDDVYRNVLTVEGMPSREQNTGGDTGQAVYLRNGWDFSEKRAELSEPIFKKSERKFLRCALKILSTKNRLSLVLSDIEVKVTRSKTDNMVIKAQVLKYLLDAGIEPGRAIKTCNLWSDPTQAEIDSKPFLDAKYSPKVIKGQGGKADGQGTNNNSVPGV